MATLFFLTWHALDSVRAVVRRTDFLRDGSVDDANSDFFSQSVHSLVRVGYLPSTEPDVDLDRMPVHKELVGLLQYAETVCLGRVGRV